VKRLLALALLLVVPVQAQMPDAHVQTVYWDPDQIIPITGAPGWQITVEFAPDERIENVAIGDALAWQVVPNKRARNLFLKPLLKNAATNMTVITDRRRYIFALDTGPRRASTPWVVRFEYPPPPVVLSAEVVVEQAPVIENSNYAKAGDAGLLPARVWDDGRMTYFEFAEEVAIPAIFMGKPGKDEALVNSAMRGRTVVVQQLAAIFTLREGKRVATVRRTDGIEK
jgi:type IV secretion system protein VirB9